jgi:hypothetical protein
VRAARAADSPPRVRGHRLANNQHNDRPDGKHIPRLSSVRPSLELDEDAQVKRVFVR